MAHRALLDGNEQLLFFSQTLEQVCRDIIDIDGKMTKDLAIAIHGKATQRSHYLNTEQFISAIEEKLRQALRNGDGANLSKL